MNAAAPPVLNISAYRFVELGDLPALRAECLARAFGANLKGTILNGVNLKRARLAQAKFDGATYLETMMPDGTVLPLSPSSPGGGQQQDLQPR